MEEIKGSLPNFQYQPSTSPISPVPHSSSSGAIIKIVAGIIIIGVVGTGISLATQIWDPLWNPFRAQPDKVIQEMSNKIKDIKTVHIDSKINLDLKNTSTNETMNIFLSLDGDSDATDAKNSKSSLTLNLDVEGKIQYGNISFGLGGESKTIGKDSYIKIDK